MPNESTRVFINIWVARLIPLLLTAAVAYATYVFVNLLSVNYLLRRNHAKGSAFSILTTYFILFMLMITSFFRLVFVTYFDPPYVPLGASHSKSKQESIGGRAYSNEKNDIDSPGLESFYTKDVFVTDSTGKPRWCSPCGNWKPDRTHHCQSSGRCIKKMDHFCPWIGGPVGENNFKFFIQFTSYSVLYCTYLLSVMIIYVFGTQSAKMEYVDPQFFVIIGLAGFFMLFTGGMAFHSIWLATKNLTQVESLGSRVKTHFLAIFVPPWGNLNSLESVEKKSLNYSLITYPLGPDENLKWTKTSFRPLTATHSKKILRGADSGANYPNFVQEHFQTDHLTFGKSSEDFSKSEIDETSLGRLSVEILDRVDNEIQLDQSSEIPNFSTKTSIRESISDRERNAVRKFAIVQTNRGENPWDLGSRLSNWRTVMGESKLEWLLPIRRSPCCKHDDTESQYEVGPVIFSIRAKLGFQVPESQSNCKVWEQKAN